MKLCTKEELISEIKQIFKKGWIPSVKNTTDTRNDGAVGNTLEVLLGIEENNLPIPNANEWELKGQRAHTSSLITLKHIEPSPQAAKIVANILLPKYGWPHKEAGKKYPRGEKSFRSTTGATEFTKRGFKIVVDRKENKVKFVFDSYKADIKDNEVIFWLNSVKERVGLGKLEPEPYWGFNDLERTIGEKAKNCFYVIADARIESRKEYFKYEKLFILSGFSFNNFLKCIEDGSVLIDFDARTGHNHGTKFRLRQDSIPKLYSKIDKVI